MGGVDTDTPPVLLASAERTATTTSEDVRSYHEDSGAFLVLDVTKAPAAADTLKVVIEAKDEVSGKYVPITAFAATKKGEELEAGVTLAFTIATGAAETAAIANHEVQALPLPRHWRAKVEHSGEGKWTYSLGYQALAA